MSPKELFEASKKDTISMKFVIIGVLLGIVSAVVIYIINVQIDSKSHTNSSSNNDNTIKSAVQPNNNEVLEKINDEITVIKNEIKIIQKTITNMPEDIALRVENNSQNIQRLSKKIENITNTESVKIENDKVTEDSFSTNTCEDRKFIKMTVIASNLNVRSKPGGDIIGGLVKGDVVCAFRGSRSKGKKFEWLKINSPTKGWIANSPRFLD